jgi:hypothetical protein
VGSVLEVRIGSRKEVKRQEIEILVKFAKAVIYGSARTPGWGLERHDKILGSGEWMSGAQALGWALKR